MTLRSVALRYDPQVGGLVGVDVLTGLAVAGEPPEEVEDLTPTKPKTRPKAKTKAKGTAVREGDAGDG